MCALGPGMLDTMALWYYSACPRFVPVTRECGGPSCLRLLASDRLHNWRLATDPCFFGADVSIASTAPLTVPSTPRPQSAAEELLSPEARIQAAMENAALDPRLAGRTVSPVVFQMAARRLSWDPVTGLGQSEWDMLSRVRPPSIARPAPEPIIVPAPSNLGEDWPTFDTPMRLDEAPLAVQLDTGFDTALFPERLHRPVQVDLASPPLVTTATGQAPMDLD